MEAKNFVSKGEKMDGQNFNNEQNTENAQYSNYQDNTSNVVYQQPVNTVEPVKKTNGLQTASLVLGILSICFCCCYGVPGLILGIIGLICGIKGNKESKSGVGTAGIICSIIGIIFSVFMVIYFALIFVGLFSDPEFLDSIYSNYY